MAPLCHPEAYSPKDLAQTLQDRCLHYPLREYPEYAQHDNDLDLLMRLRTSKQVHYDSGPNMTPLVDVVMVILIFLMLAGSFAGAEHYLVSNVPFTDKGGGGAPPPPGFVPDEPLEIRVDSPVPDRFVARAGQITVDDANQLRVQLQRMRDSLEKAGTKRDKVQVVIEPGRNVKYKFLVDVYQAALQADFQKVGFAPAH